MWETEKFIVANGFTQFNESNMAQDLSPYDFFDGEIKKELIRQPQKTLFQDEKKDVRIDWL